MKQVVPNQWQIIADMKAADRSDLTNVLRMVNAARRGIKIRTVPGTRRMSEQFSSIKNRAALVFLLGLTGVALYFCYILIAPFLRPIIFSAVIAILFYPLHSRFLRRIRNRNLSIFLHFCPRVSSFCSSFCRRGPLARHSQLDYTTSTNRLAVQEMEANALAFTSFIFLIKQLSW